jgi:hypothetical protein
MADDKTKVPRRFNALTVSGLNGKSITGVDVYYHGNVFVVEITFSGGSQFIKHKQLQSEIGGTLEWGTGTPVL